MFSKKETVNSDKVETIIGKETTFQGTLKAKGTLRVDGRLEGEIECEGDVVVGETGVIIAEVKAKNLLIAGTIKGNVVISNKLEIATSGKLEGDVTTPSIIIDDGAIFQGNCQMTKESGKEGK